MDAKYINLEANYVNSFVILVYSIQLLEKSVCHSVVVPRNRFCIVLRMCLSQKLSIRVTCARVTLTEIAIYIKCAINVKTNNNRRAVIKTRVQSKSSE